ncbi:MAG: hypothetical protein IJ480_01035 [Clostridia bacterium]|nr:hypothetical protein [Clostridia bacterium]
MEHCLNEALRPILLKTRARLGLTQNRMARRYVMANNTYSELEAGKHGFGSLTIILLLRDQEDPKKVLKDLGNILDQAHKEVTLIV